MAVSLGVHSLLLRLSLVSNSAPVVHVAPFRFDVTPPLGHPLLAGLVQPVVGIDDALEAIGYVLLGAGAPIVICAVDWAGLLNDAHRAWREALAAVAGTTPDRVAVQCVHQHGAPFVCFEAQAVIARHDDLPATFDPVFFAECLSRAQAAVRAALGHPQRITHVAHGAAVVAGVASNRRVSRDASGRVNGMRLSSCTDPVLTALPEGRIDPELQTIALCDEHGAAVIVSHYYATHPMSYYRDGRVSSDFCGLARKRRQAATPGCTQIYFTGCAGDVAAGKFNDGSPAARVALTDRMHAAMLAAERVLAPVPIHRIDWRTESVLPVPLPEPTVEHVGREMSDPATPLVDRILPAFRLAWLQRHARREPLVLSRLRLNDITALHLPAEFFVEFQLRARALRPAHPVAVAAYGDGGPWYVPPREEYAAGGYEIGVTFCREETDAQMTGALQRLLAS